MNFLYRIFLVSVAVQQVAHAWSLVPQQQQQQQQTPILSRRDALLKTIQTTATAGALIGTTLISGPQTSYADVSEGNALPDGARQFSNVVRAKSDLQAIKKRVSSSSSNMDKKEWENVSGFLRRVYGLSSDDMKSIASTMDATKKKQAMEYVDDIKKLTKSADGPAQNQDGAGFVAYADKIDATLDNFLALLQDVPDEL